MNQVLPADIFVVVNKTVLQDDRKILVSLYEENFIIKSLVDIFSIFLKAIIGIFKK